MIRSAYVHVPFCSSLCRYCAFARTLNTSQIQSWLDVIVPEIQEGLEQERLKDPSFRLETLYFGGGTPGLLSQENLQRLAEPFLDFLAPDCEWTLESNPESLSAENLLFWRRLGISRLSVGVQSFQDASLKKLGRRHTAAQAIEGLQRARACGFERISADLIYGLPWMSLEDTRQDLLTFLKQDLDHLSIYSLQIEENSVFGKQNLQPADEDLEADEYEMICAMLQKAGWRHYEVSSFCLPGQRSRHNLQYWQDQDYLGFGWGAVGRTEQALSQVPGSLEAYLKGRSVRESIPDPDRPFEAIMMALRTDEGLDIQAWNRKYHRDFEQEYAGVLKRYADVLKIRDGRICPTERGMEILNTVLVAFLEAD